MSEHEEALVLTNELMSAFSISFGSILVSIKGSNNSLYVFFHSFPCGCMRLPYLTWACKCANSWTVVIKKAYTAQHMLNSISAFYRVYVKEGQTEVQVQDWTAINRTPNEYYFMFDTRDKLPNEYYVDIKVNTSGEVDIYKKQIKFQIVNKK